MARGHWDWPGHLPYRHGVKAAGQMIFLGGQVVMARTATSCG
jgi:hypothetical protein